MKVKPRKAWGFQKLIERRGEPSRPPASPLILAPCDSVALSLGKRQRFGAIVAREDMGMAFPNDDPTVQRGDRTIQLIDWLVGRLEECLGEVLPLQTDDLLKDYAQDARNSMASAIEQLRRARVKKEQQLGGRTC
jgi:hypothetical protein